MRAASLAARAHGYKWSGRPSLESGGRPEGSTHKKVPRQTNPPDGFDEAIGSLGAAEGLVRQQEESRFQDPDSRQDEEDSVEPARHLWGVGFWEAGVREVDNSTTLSLFIGPFSSSLP